MNAQLMGSQFPSLEGQSPSHWTTMEFPDLVSSLMLLLLLLLSRFSCVRLCATT